MSHAERRDVDQPLHLRVGEWVEVRTADEILGTLDQDGCVAALPFMPEMLPYCGRKFRVQWSAHKTSDTIELFEIRRLANAVHLEELRCDGSSHGGCQAGCLLFWKECWLKRVPQDGRISETTGQGGERCGGGSAGGLGASRLLNGTRRCVGNGKPECYRCQATEMLNATTAVRRRTRWDPRFYVRDLTSRNVKPLEFIQFGALAILNAFLLRWFGRRFPHIRGLAGGRTPSLQLGLEPGEWVRVRSKEEIELTLNKGQRNRGLWFDVELVPFCDDGTYRVLRRVERIINEKTGELVRLRNPCIILEGVTCSGNYSHRRMFSRRHEYHFWHEIWLRRAGPPGEGRRAAERSSRLLKNSNFL